MKITAWWNDTTIWFFNLAVPSWSRCINVNNNDWISSHADAQATVLSTFVKPEVTDAFNCQPWQKRSAVLITRPTWSVHKAPGSTRKHACGDTTTSQQQSTVTSDKFTRVSTNVGVVISDSIVHNVMDSIPSTLPHGRPKQESVQHWPFHIISSHPQLITLLITPSSVPPYTRFVDTFTAFELSRCTIPTHFIGTIFASHWPVTSSTAEERLSSWLEPSHTPKCSSPRWQSHCLISTTVKNRRPRDFLHWLLHKTLHTSNQTHSHLAHQFPNSVARQRLRSDVSNVWLDWNMLRRFLFLVHGWLQPQSLHLDVTAFPNSQP